MSTNLSRRSFLRRASLATAAAGAAKFFRFPMSSWPPDGVPAEVFAAR